MNAQVNYHKLHEDCIEIHYFYEQMPGVIEIKIPIDNFETWIENNLLDVYESCKVNQITDMTNSVPEFSDIKLIKKFEMELFEEYHMEELIAKQFINDFIQLKLSDFTKIKDPLIIKIHKKKEQTHGK